VAGSEFVATASPTSLITITIPDLVIETNDGYDYVSIPDGDILLAEGMPRVPYYVVGQEYPAGYRIQDVDLISASSAIALGKLNLPTISMVYDQSAITQIPQSTVAGWYPQKYYDWQAVRNSDSTSSLTISIYPFFYNTTTKEAQLTKEFGFEIKYILSSVSIVTFNANKAAFGPTEEAVFDVQLSNQGDPCDVVVKLVIKDYYSGEVVIGLPLRQLKSLISQASISFQYSLADTKLGDYYAEVSVTDQDGNILDTCTTDFRVNSSAIVETPPPTQMPSTRGIWQSKIWFLVVGLTLAIVLALGLILRCRSRRAC